MWSPQTWLKTHSLAERALSADLRRYFEDQAARIAAEVERAGVVGPSAVGAIPWDDEHAGLLATVVTMEEAGSWFALRAEEYGASATYLYDATGTAVWTASALLIFGFGVLRRVLAARIAAVAALGVAAAIFISTYEPGMVRDCDWFVNARFLVGLCVTAAGLGMGIVLRREASGYERSERLTGEVLAMGSTLAILGVNELTINHSLRTDEIGRRVTGQCRAAFAYKDQRSFAIVFRPIGHPWQIAHQGS